ncbi:hypothetical protein LTR02_016087 [Friedmanniomyces endolithicus]|nr:hypothetical protein LTR02_016087 [Friedmanniomyces endolithicus]
MNNEDTDIYSQSAIADGVEHAVVRVASGNASLRPSTRHTAIRQTNSSDISLKRWWTAPASDETAFDHLVPKGKGVSFVGRPLPELWIEGIVFPAKELRTCRLRRLVRRKRVRATKEGREGARVY